MKRLVERVKIDNNTADEYKKVVKSYCDNLLKLKKGLAIKILCLISVIFYLIVLHATLPSFFDSAKEMVGFAMFVHKYSIWLILVPMFIIGKSLGQNLPAIGFAKEAVKEIDERIVGEFIDYIEGCYVDEEYKKLAPGERILLKIGKRYSLVSRDGYKYRISEPPDIKFYINKPVKVKITLALESNIVLKITEIKTKKYDLSDSQGQDMGSKLEMMEERNILEISTRKIELPTLVVKQRQENFVYMVIDIYYDQCLQVRGQREMNEIINELKKDIKTLLDETDEKVENIKKELDKIVINVFSKNLREIVIKKIESEYVVIKCEERLGYNQLQEYVSEDRDYVRL